MMSSDSPPKPILSAITFPITLPLDRTVYLSYYSRYSRFCYFDHFFWPYLRIHWTDFAHLKDNIVGKKISFNVGHHHFFCICHISRDFLKKYQPLMKCRVALKSVTILTITPEPLNRFSTTMLISIFSVSVIFLEIFSKNLSDTSILPLFDHFFANISGSNEPILLIFELSLTN